MQLRTPTPRLILLVTVSLLGATFAFAQAGQLDSSFATGGIFATNTASANAMAIQSDGKIVIAGTAQSNGQDLLIRLTTAGALDSSFGSGGVAVLPPGGAPNVFGFFALAIQSDGKIVAALGDIVSGVPGLFAMQVVRANSDGSLDTSFGNGGFTPAISFPEQSGNLALQSDGKILVASGITNPNGVPSQMARFTSSGQVDTAFGNGGVTNLPYQGPTHIAALANGKILVSSGVASRLVFQATPAAQSGAITRFNSNGTVDASFGGSGSIATVGAASALTVQSDGKIVVAGSLASKLNSPGTRNNVGFGVARYQANGMADRTFGSGGVAVVDFGSSAPISGAFAVAIQSNGDIVAGGGAGGTLFQNQFTQTFGLARVTSTGKLDTAFGSGGIVVTNLGAGSFAWITDLAIQSDGKIVAAGTSQSTSTHVTAYAARYLAQ